MQESNLRPSRCKRAALASELIVYQADAERPLELGVRMAHPAVVPTGFEPVWPGRKPGILGP